MAYFSFTNKLLKGETIQVFNYGNCKRDFTYINDIVEGMVRIVQYVLEKWNGGTDFWFCLIRYITLEIVHLKIFLIS